VVGGFGFGAWPQPPHPPIPNPQSPIPNPQYNEENINVNNFNLFKN